MFPKKLTMDEKLSILRDEEKRLRSAAGANSLSDEQLGKLEDVQKAIRVGQKRKREEEAIAEFSSRRNESEREQDIQASAMQIAYYNFPREISGMRPTSRAYKALLEPGLLLQQKEYISLSNTDPELFLQLIKSKKYKFNDEFTLDYCLKQVSFGSTYVNIVEYIISSIFDLRRLTDLLLKVLSNYVYKSTMFQIDTVSPSFKYICKFFLSRPDIYNSNAQYPFYLFNGYLHYLLVHFMAFGKINHFMFLSSIIKVTIRDLYITLVATWSLNKEGYFDTYFLGMWKSLDLDFNETITELPFTLEDFRIIDNFSSRILFPHGVNVNKNVPNFDYKLMDMVVFQKRYDVFKFLLSKGVKPRTNYGEIIEVYKPYISGGIYNNFKPQKEQKLVDELYELYSSDL